MRRLNKFDNSGYYIMTDVRKCPSGAVRDNSEGKGRMDLLPGHALLRVHSIVGPGVNWPDATMELAKVFEKGANHYAARNWEQGMYADWFIDSGQRHLEKAVGGWGDEPHLFMALWNFMCLVDTVSRVQKKLLPAEYLGHYTSLAMEGSIILGSNIRTATVNKLIDSAKYNIHFVLSGGAMQSACLAAAYLYEAADRLARAKRLNDPLNLGILTPLFSEEGAFVK
jgi:hypothetical protein